MLTIRIRTNRNIVPISKGLQLKAELIRSYRSPYDRAAACSIIHSLENRMFHGTIRRNKTNNPLNYIDSFKDTDITVVSKLIRHTESIDYLRVVQAPSLKMNKLFTYISSQSLIYPAKLTSNTNRRSMPATNASGIQLCTPSVTNNRASFLKTERNGTLIINGEGSILPTLSIYLMMREALATSPKVTTEIPTNELSNVNSKVHDMLRKTRTMEHYLSMIFPIQIYTLFPVKTKEDNPNQHSTTYKVLLNTRTDMNKQMEVVRLLVATDTETIRKDISIATSKWSCFRDYLSSLNIDNNTMLTRLVAIKTNILKSINNIEILVDPPIRIIFDDDKRSFDLTENIGIPNNVKRRAIIAGELMHRTCQRIEENIYNIVMDRSQRIDIRTTRQGNNIHQQYYGSTFDSSMIAFKTMNAVRGTSVRR